MMESLGTISALVTALIFRNFSKKMVLNEVKNYWKRLPPLTIRRGVTTIILSIAFGQAIFFKCLNISAWLSEGGISQSVNAIEALRNDKSWHPNSPFRVVSVPYRLPVHIAPAAGIEALDGNHSLPLKRVAEYWMHGVLRNYRLIDDSFIQLSQPGFDPKCCDHYDLSMFADINLLKIANVSHVLRFLPLKGPNVSLADTKQKEKIPVRNTSPILQRLAGYIRQIFNPPEILVYTLGDYLHRVFAATELIEAPDSLDIESFIDLIGSNAMRRIAVVRHSEIPHGIHTTTTLRVKNYDLKTDKITIDLYAPDGGIVVINVRFSPFWTASLPNAETDIFPVNQVQMGVAIPAETSSIVVQYKKPDITRWIQNTN